MFECFKNESCFKEWVIENVIWEIIIVILTLIFLTLLPKFISSIIIARKLLKNNRNNLGKGLGRHYADHFIEIWNTKEDQFKKYGFGQNYFFMGSGSTSVFENLINDDLEKLKLVKIFDTRRGYEVVRAIKNWKNTLVYFLIKNYLIIFIGDDKKHYRELERNQK